MWWEKSKESKTREAPTVHLRKLDAKKNANKLETNHGEVFKILPKKVRQLSSHAAKKNTKNTIPRLTKGYKRLLQWLKGLSNNYDRMRIIYCMMLLPFIKDSVVEL